MPFHSNINKKEAEELLQEQQEMADALLIKHKKKAEALIKKNQEKVAKLLNVDSDKVLLSRKIQEKAKKLFKENQKVAEELFEKNKNLAIKLLKYQLIVENSSDAIIGTTLDGVITSWNGGAVKMFGYRPDEVIGKSGSTLFPPEIWKKVLPLLKKVKAKEVIPDYDIFGLRKDGTRIDLAISISPIITAKGEVISASVVERDITERKRLEQKTKDMKETFETYTDKAPVGIFVSDETGRYIDVNTMACKMSGYKKEELLKISVKDFLAPEYLEKGLETFSTVKEKGYSKAEVLVRKKSGETFWIDLHSAKIDEHSFIAFCIDITEKKKSWERIEELHELRNKFISIISHQLRTPLTSVNWNLEMVINGDFGTLDDTVLNFLKVTHKASLEITDRIHDILTAMDIEEGRISFEKRKVAIDSVVNEVANNIKPLCKSKNVSCTFIPPKKALKKIEGDSDKLKSVVSKLIDNAIIYTKEKGKITFTLRQVGKKIRFEVKDTGIGIPKSEQSKVFTRFFRASNASTMQTDAFGLSLFIAKSFIDQHKGTIGFESTEGEGSTFWFEIPIKQAV